MVQHYADFAVIPLLEAPGLVDRGLLVVPVCQVNLAHGKGHVAVDIDGSVVVVVTFPVLEGEAGVGGIGLVVADEVGQRPFLIDAEGLFASGQGGLEQDRAIVVAVGAVVAVVLAFSMPPVR